MLLFLKRLMLVVAAALLVQTTFGFALLGPRDTWQINNLGYDPQGDNGDLGGPKNLGEEWRWTYSPITYAFDDTFINYFGTNGIAAVEQAIGLFNRELTNSLMAMSDDELRRKPLDTKRIHPTAQALGVLDLKSYTMGMLAEQLGLAGAVRWTWALRDRQIFTGQVTNYLVIQRNFDPFTLKPSRYVNGHKWTYFIGTFPTGIANNTYDDAAEVAIDQAGDNPFISSAVSAVVGEDLLSTGLREGEYYSALTQDDIGGLRYIYRLNNVNTESLPLATARDTNTFAPSLREVNTNQVIFINGTDAFTFFTNAFFGGPSNLLSQFTNLVILSTNVTVTNIKSTNFVLTNITSSGVFTDFSLPTIISNQDLFLFSLRSQTNDANTLRGFYPQLIITKTNGGFDTVVSETFFLTNGTYGAANEVYIATNRVTNLVATYRYQYANVITNYASAVTDLELQEIRRAPWSTPSDFLLVTNRTATRVPLTSGGFYILDRTTNAALVGYTLTDTNGVPLQRVTNIIGNTNLVFQFTNIFDPTDVRVLNIVNNFTNVQYGAFPIFLNGVSGQQIVQQVVTNQQALYSYTFGSNLLVFPPGNGNTNVVLQTITFTNGGPVRITQTNVFTDIPTGTVLVLDTNRFVLRGDFIETSGLATNTIIAFTNAATGEFITQLLIFQTNSIQFAAFPVTFVQPTTPQLRAGIDRVRFERHRYAEFLNQTNSVYERHYALTAMVNDNPVGQELVRVAGPDIVFSTHEVTSGQAFPFAVVRTILWQQGNTQIPGGSQFDRGPGQVLGASTIAFSTLSPSWIIQTPGATTEENSFLVLQWGSFDSKTLVPRIYPEDITSQLKRLEDYALRRNQ
jgi:hypothetical protein